MKTHTVEETVVAYYRPLKAVGLQLPYYWKSTLLFSLSLFMYAFGKTSMLIWTFDLNSFVDFVSV